LKIGSVAAGIQDLKSDNNREASPAMTNPLLPRGAEMPSQSTAPIATARWATTAEIARYRYREGDIYLGITKGPDEKSLPLLKAIDEFLVQLQLDQTIEMPWKQEVSAGLLQYRAALMTTNRIPIGSNDDRHIKTIAGTRSGKGVSAIIPNLIYYPGSIIAIDPKNTNAQLTASRRAHGSSLCRGMGQKVAVLAPYKVSGVDPSLLAAFNPLDLLDENDEEIIDKASSIAEALIIRNGTGDSVHFDESARLLVKGIILFVALNTKDIGSGNRNLGFVYDLLCRGTKNTPLAQKDADDDEVDAFQHLLKLMELETRSAGVTAAIASTMTMMGPNEFGSVLSTARRNLEFLERPGIRRSLATSTFRFEELKTAEKGMTVYLCLPVTRMIDTARWLRLMITCALESIYLSTEKPKCGHPILMLLEEMAALQHMQSIETAVGYAAEFSLKIWGVLQDLPQLQRHYREAWETFMANAGVVHAFGNGDKTTLEYLSKKLGEMELIQVTQSQTASLAASSNDAGDFTRMSTVLRGGLGVFSILADQETKGNTTTTTSSNNTQVLRTPLMLPDEIERYFAREQMTEIVAIKGERPFALVRETYFNNPEFYGLYQPDRRVPYASLGEADALRAKAAQAHEEALEKLIQAASAYLQSVAGTFNELKRKAGKR
jgi:type IV secretory pathway TraG/TraD family ATPase VirD4